MVRNKTFLKGSELPYSDPVQTTRVLKVMVLIDIFEGQFEGAEAIACIQ